VRPPLIEFENVTVRRGERLALRGINLRIGRGENVAIVGPNGCGKSTLIKTITRELYPLPLPGSAVRILGSERWHVFELRSHLGIVSNDLTDAFHRSITGLEAVLSGFFSSIGIWPHQVISEDMRSRALEALARAGAVHLAERTVDEMSSGEARRVLIARALAHNPEALVLDEPTNSLDLRALGELTRTLRSLIQAGTSLILVTHHLPDIVPEIDHVVLMRDGQVALEGPRERLLTGEVLSYVFGCKVEVFERGGYFYALDGSGPQIQKT
jgi:iron complex transport system ATP-binding protein